jgi:hypothetical protein
MPIYFQASISATKAKHYQVTANNTTVTQAHIMRMPVHFIAVWFLLNLCSYCLKAILWERRLTSFHGKELVLIEQKVYINEI